jgi:hypothetical protein
MDFKEVRWEDVDWNNVVLERGRWWSVVNTVMNLWVP